MKVVHLSVWDHGGAGNAAYRLHTALLKDGVDSRMLVLIKKSNDPTVSAIRSGQKGLLVGEEPCPRSSVFAAGRENWNRKLERYPGRQSWIEAFSDSFSTIDISELPEIEQADILHLHWIPTLIDLPSFAEVLGTKPVLWTMHDMNPFTGGCHYAGDCKAYVESCGCCPMLGSRERFDISRENYLIKAQAYSSMNINWVCPSNWLAECASESSLLGERQGRVIPYALPLEVFRPLPRREVRRQLGIPEDAFALLFGAASLENQRKGFGYLMQALQMLASKKFDKQVVLMTFGKQDDETLNSLSFPVMPFGFVSDPEHLAVLYNAADAVALPSLEDNLPNILLESIACGTPVIGFNVGGVPDVVDHMENGFLAEPKNSADVVRGMEWAMSASSDTVRQRCRVKALHDYSFGKIAAEYKDAYRSIIEEKEAAKNFAAMNG